MGITKLLFLISLAVINSLTETSTYSNYDQIKQTKLEVNFDVNFEQKMFYVTEKLYMKALQDGEVIVLDTNFIEVDSVIDSNTGDELKFALDKLNALTPFGVPLKIYMDYKKDDEIILLIKVRTTAAGQAAQFLEKELTEGKEYPFMFTQCEASMARHIMAIQDTPAVKLTVFASINVPKPLTAVYAGIFKSKIEKQNSTTYFYEQKVPIPSYLISLAAGLIEERIMSDRCKIYGEKEIVDKAAKELDETEKFIQVAEAYVYDYEWGQYNLLVLPRSFPFGGMENPCLTFVTPTIIAGDKSLAFVVAHEISHSWSGNLITMDNWGEFWLNEGFTMFIQRKITQVLYGEDRAKISAASGMRILNADVNNVGTTHEFSKLCINLLGRSPEEILTNIPYEKGYNLLYYLETLVNSNSDRDTMKMIMKDYFTTFKFKSIHTSDFKDLFIERLNHYLPDKAKEILDKVDWDAWFYGTGMPPLENDFSNELSRQANENVEKLLAGTIKVEEFKPLWDNWHSDVKEYFLKTVVQIEGGISDSQYDFLSQKMNLPEGCNADITSDFYEIMLTNRKQDKMKELDEFLGKFGRLKYLKPLYVELAQIDKSMAMEIYNSHKATYHPIATAMLDQLLKSV